MHDLGIKNGTVYLNGGFFNCNIYIKNGVITNITNEDLGCKVEENASGKLVLPGFIDPHVHFSLGVGSNISSDDFYTGSIKGVLGGVTTYIDFLDPIKSVEEIEEAYDKVAKLCLEQGALDVLISDTEEREESIWKARGAFLEAIKGSTTYMDEVDMVVPRNCVNQMVEYLHSLQDKVGIRIKSFGHAGDGNLHAYILKDSLSDAEWEKRMHQVMELVYEKAKELGGQVSGEHGIGYEKKTYLRESLPEVNLQLMNSIKKAFDPKNILNPHKIAQM